MKKEDLLLYEMPLIAEYISIPFIQDIIAEYLARKVKRKWNRLQKRNARARMLSRKPKASTTA